MTLTLVCHPYPRELFRTPKKAEAIIHEKYSGIFRVEGKISIPVQIVVSSRLPEGKYEGLKLLASACTKDAVLCYAGTVIGVCLDINEKLSSELRRIGVMNEVIRDIFRKDFDEAKSRGVPKKECMATGMLKNYYI